MLDLLLTPLAVVLIMRQPGNPLLTTWQIMNPQQQKTRPRPVRLGDVGKHVDDAVNRATVRLDEECERLIAYLNDEVVPAVRQRSSRGLRRAAERLSHFAEYMESSRRS